MPPINFHQWDEYLKVRPEAHLLQQGAWGQVKADFGWEPFWVQTANSGAQVLFRRLAPGLRIAYIPRGPVGEDWQVLWPEIDILCRHKGAIFLKVEPDAWLPLDSSQSAALAGFHPSRPIQPARTVLVSLEGNEDDWLGRMKQKTRYNIRLAGRKGVVVHESNDLEMFHQLMEVTGKRDGFAVHSKAYYQRAFDLFAATGRCALLAAEFESKPLAALMVFASGRRAWYFYGASSDEERSRMPTYLIQWEAMRWAARQGCTEYDLWGIPDLEEEALEDEFASRADGLWGVYRFKRGFGGQVVRSAGAWDRVYQPLLYRIYLWLLSRRGGEAG